MAAEIASRLLAVIVAVGFTLVLTMGRLSVVPKGRWTFVVLFVLGFTMCTVAGIRDGLGATPGAGSWETSLQTALGIAAFALLLAVLIGFDWRMGVLLLGLQIVASWMLALAQAASDDPGRAAIGIATLALAFVAATITLGLSSRAPIPIGPAPR
jgi:hypothetical protein